MLRLVKRTPLHTLRLASRSRRLRPSMVAAAERRPEIRKRALHPLDGTDIGHEGIDIACADAIHGPAGCLAAHGLAVPALTFDLDDDPVIVRVLEPCAVIVHRCEIQDVVKLQHVEHARSLYFTGDTESTIRQLHD